MARSGHCECSDRFTCWHCLRNAPPWHWTPATHEEWEAYRARKKETEKRLTRS